MTAQLTPDKEMQEFPRAKQQFTIVHRILNPRFPADTRLGYARPQAAHGGTGSHGLG